MRLKPALTTATIAAGLVLALGLGLGWWTAAVRSISDDPLPLAGSMRLGSCPPASASWYDEAARHDMVAATPGCAVEVDSLRLRNVDVEVGVYWPIMSAGSWMRDAAEAGGDGFASEYWRITERYMARTTTGDTLRWWPGAIAPNLLDPECRRELVGAFTRAHPEADFAVLDHCTIPPPDLLRFFPAAYAERDGAPDYDGDGVPCAEDTDELTALRAAYLDIVQLAHEVRPTLRLYPNGQLALRDSTFAAEVNGAYVECFPRWHFGASSANYAGALDPTSPTSVPSLLRAMPYRAPGLLLLESLPSDDAAVGAVAALWPRAVELHRGDPAGRSTWAEAHADLGPAAGPAEWTGDGWRRPFAHGVLEVRAEAPDRLREVITRD